MPKIYKKSYKKKTPAKKAADQHIKNIAKAVVARAAETKVYIGPGSVAGPMNIFPYVFPVAYGLSPGTAQNQRVGDSIQLRGVALKGFVRVNSVKNVSTNFYGLLCWASIKVSPPNANGATPNGTYSDYMKVGPTTGILTNRPDTDKVVPLRTIRKQFKADSTLSDQILRFNIYHRFNRKCQFLDDSGVGWLKDKQLYFVLLSDDPDIRGVFESRVYFKDS